MTTTLGRGAIWLGLLVVCAVSIAPGAPARAADKVTVFTGPTVLYDAVWMADAKGFYKDENLDVQFRLFPTGATALQTFKSGQGDIVLSGDLPGLIYWENNNHDFRFITILERDSKGYTVTANNGITKAGDLAGKTIATKVGSNGSFFISEYLRKNGLKPGDVTIKDLDAQLLPTALCQGNIDAYFIWQPFGRRALEICPDKVHELSSAEGYFSGYAYAGARPGWLASKEGHDIAIRFLRATAKGAEVARTDFPAVAQYAHEKYSIEETPARFQWEINERVETFDAKFNADFCLLTKWMVDQKLLKEQVRGEDVLWMDGVEALGAPTLIKSLQPCDS
jgi:ABC-type nitrate/sulfonate/bicarbonate transport system substrate-binding protein